MADSDEIEFMKSLLADFIHESEEIITKIQNDIIDYENGLDSEAKKRNILLDLHSLKGSAQALNLSQISNLIHNLEQDVLDGDIKHTEKWLAQLDEISDLIQKFR